MTDELEKLAEATLPVVAGHEALPHLRRPFSKDAVKWKVQSAWQGGAMIVAHIDARLVIERLNAVVGLAWSEDYVPVGQAMRCDLTVFDATRRGYGTAGKFEAAKSLESDSLKRAAVKFGVGISVYALARVNLTTGDALKIGAEVLGPGLKQKANPKDEKKPYSDITPTGDRWLQHKYGLWLDASTKGGKFGPVLDHGGQEDAQGVEEEPVSGAPATDAELPVDDDRAKELRAECEEAFVRLQEADPAAMLPGAFRSALGEAGSHESLIELRERLNGMAEAGAA